MLEFGAYLSDDQTKLNLIIEELTGINPHEQKMNEALCIDDFLQQATSNDHGELLAGCTTFDTISALIQKVRNDASAAVVAFRRTHRTQIMNRITGKDAKAMKEMYKHLKRNDAAPSSVDYSAASGRRALHLRCQRAARSDDHALAHSLQPARRQGVHVEQIP